MSNYMDETEQYLKDAEKNIEAVGKVFGGFFYKIFFWIAGGLEYLIKPFLPEDEDEAPF